MPLTLEWKGRFQEGYESMAGQGMRVLGHAQLSLDGSVYADGFPYDETNVPMRGLIVLGMTGLQDPPKPGVPEAIEVCNKAGI